MENKGFSPKLAGGLGCIAGILCTILVAAIAICVFIVRWGNQQDWKVAADDSTAQTADSAAVTESYDDPTAMIYSGNFKEVNYDESDTQLTMNVWEDVLTIEILNHDEVLLEAHGKIVREDASRSDRGGMILPICLKQYEDDREVLSDDVTIILEEEPERLFSLHVVFDNEPSESAIRNLMVEHTLYNADDNMQEINGEIPFKINKEKPTIKAMMRGLYRYLFSEELYNTVRYIKSGCDDTELAEYERIVFDERNRFFSYSWAEKDICLEAKYFWMKGEVSEIMAHYNVKEGCILLVLDQHDASYNRYQHLFFYIINPENQTITQWSSTDFIAEKWVDRADAIFQVRYATEGLVVVFNDGNGGLAAKTLKFNGTRFID